jgi:hypothetical protein
MRSIRAVLSHVSHSLELRLVRPPSASLLEHPGEQIQLRSSRCLGLRIGSIALGHPRLLPRERNALRISVSCGRLIAPGERDRAHALLEGILVVFPAVQPRFTAPDVRNSEAAP